MKEIVTCGYFQAFKSHQATSVHHLEFSCIIILPFTPKQLQETDLTSHWLTEFLSSSVREQSEVTNHKSLVQALFKKKKKKRKKLPLSLVSYKCSYRGTRKISLFCYSPTLTRIKTNCVLAMPAEEPSLCLQ